MSASGELARLHAQDGVAMTTVWGFAVPARFSSHAEECGFVERTVGLFDQSYRGIIDLDGAAARELLERITSNHPGSLVARSSGQNAALLTAKGRLVAGFWLFRSRDTRFRIILFDPVRDALLREIGKYAFLSDVDVVERAGLAILALRGPAAERVVAELLPSPPASHLERATVELDGAAIDVIRVADAPLDTRAAGFDLVVPAPASTAVWTRLRELTRTAGGGPVGWEAAESLRIDAGFARYGLDYEDQSFPTEVGWGAALTYDKCYVGQEVVARMRTYGSENRKLFRFAADALPAAGAKIVDASASAVGTVTSVAPPTRPDGASGLASIRRKAWDAQDLAVELESGAMLPIRPFR